MYGVDAVARGRCATPKPYIQGYFQYRKRCILSPQGSERSTSYARIGGKLSGIIELLSATKEISKVDLK